MKERIDYPTSISEEKERYCKKRANMNDWAKRVDKVDPALASLLDDNKIEGFKKVKELGLPGYKMEICNLPEFLGNPEAYLEKVKSKLVYIGLIPKKRGLERFGKAWLEKDEVANYMHRQKIKREDMINYDVVLQQCFENEYRGNVQVGEEPWQVLVEFNRADKLGISKGGSPEFFVTRKKEGRFRYSFKNEELQKVILDTILSIPNQDDGVARKFHPGYYEFFIVKKDKDSPMEPIFFDYKNYKFNWASKLDNIIEEK